MDGVAGALEDQECQGTPLKMHYVICGYIEGGDAKQPRPQGITPQGPFCSLPDYIFTQRASWALFCSRGAMYHPTINHGTGAIGRIEQGLLPDPLPYKQLVTICIHQPIIV